MVIVFIIYVLILLYAGGKPRKGMCPDCLGHGTLSKPPYDDSGICPYCDGEGYI